MFYWQFCSNYFGFAFLESLFIIYSSIAVFYASRVPRRHALLSRLKSNKKSACRMTWRWFPTCLYMLRYTDSSRLEATDPPSWIFHFLLGRSVFPLIPLKSSSPKTLVWPLGSWVQECGYHLLPIVGEQPPGRSLDTWLYGCIATLLACSAGNL